MTILPTTPILIIGFSFFADTNFECKTCLLLFWLSAWRCRALQSNSCSYPESSLTSRISPLTLVPFSSLKPSFSSLYSLTHLYSAISFARALTTYDHDVQCFPIGILTDINHSFFFPFLTSVSEGSRLPGVKRNGQDLDYCLL